LLVLIVAALVVAMDQVTKYLVLRALSLHQSVPVLPGIFHITLVRNPGAAFGLFPGGTGLFVFVSVAVIGLILFFFRDISKEGRTLRIALGLQMGGAMGNLLDRVRLGYVVDFFDFRIWPVFNVADSAIVVGIGLILLEVLRRQGRAL